MQCHENLGSGHLPGRCLSFECYEIVCQSRLDLMLIVAADLEVDRGWIDFCGQLVVQTLLLVPLLLTLGWVYRLEHVQLMRG